MITRRKTSEHNSRNAFSLFELLIVISILAVLMAFGANSLKGVFLASGVSDGIGIVDSQLKLANQIASVKNREVEIRFFQVPSVTTGESTFRAIQIVVRNAIVDPNEDGYTTPGTNSFDPEADPVDRIRYFPEGIIILDDPTRSPLVSDPSRTEGAGTVIIGEDTEAAYSYIRMKPDGSTDLDLDKSWYLTLALGSEASRNELKNFATLEMDPGNGKTVWMRAIVLRELCRNRNDPRENRPRREWL